MAKRWNAEAIEVMFAAQGITLAPGRAQRLAQAIESLLGASMADRTRDAVEFEREAAGVAAAMERLREK